MTEVLDNEHLFSTQRAIRGFKRGAIVGSVIVTGGIAAATISSPELMARSITEHPIIFASFLGIEAIHAGGWGLTFGFLDSYRPTSMIFQRHINRVLGFKKLLF